MTNQCEHNKVNVYLFDITCEQYVFVNGEIVESETDLEPEPSNEFQVYCYQCSEAMTFDTASPQTPQWAMDLYNAAYNRSYGQD